MTGVQTCALPILPLAVLKLLDEVFSTDLSGFIAIVPTACGIETALNKEQRLLALFEIAIVPTACGIETFS